MLKIGSLDLGKTPGVAIAIQRSVPPADIHAAADHRTLVELRLDALQPATPDACIAFTRQYADFPLLATIRHADEGGGWQESEQARLAAYQAVVPLVQAVDVEIEAGEITEEVTAAAHEAGGIVIGSFHDFNATPSAERLESVHARGRAMGVDIVKVAAKCNSEDDLRRLAAFTLAHQKENVITVGMGAFGLASRVFFPLLGSLITYTFLGEPTAPGQLNCADTLKYLDAFDPRKP